MVERYIETNLSSSSLKYVGVERLWHYHYWFCVRGEAGLNAHMRKQSRGITVVGLLTRAARRSVQRPGWQVAFYLTKASYLTKYDTCVSECVNGVTVVYLCQHIQEFTRSEF